MAEGERRHDCRVVAPARGNGAEHPRRRPVGGHLGEGDRRGGHVEPTRQRRRRVVLGEELGVQVAGTERVVLEHADELVAIRRQPFQPGSPQRGHERADRGVARRPVGDHLGDERVVVGRHGRTGLDAAVDAHARVGGDLEPGERAGRRSVRVGRILRGQPGLDGVAVEPSLERRRRQGGSLGDGKLELDEIEPGDELGHRVLDLQPGVHLEKPEAAVGFEEELDGSRPDVADGAGGGDGGRAHLLAERGVDGG